MTTREPGASEAFTAGLTVRPRSTAFFASRPGGEHHARIADVLVQLVMRGRSSTRAGDRSLSAIRRRRPFGAPQLRPLVVREFLAASCQNRFP